MDPAYNLVSLASECIGQSWQALDLATVEQLERSAGTLPAVARARWLLAQVAATHDAALVSASVDALARCDCWPVLLAEVASRFPPGPLAAEIIAGVLARVAPDHPLAALAGYTVDARAAFDMIDDGRDLRLRAPEWKATASLGFLLHVEAPERDCSPVQIVQNGDELLLTTDGSDDWLERNRAACPPALLIARASSLDTAAGR